MPEKLEDEKSLYRCEKLQLDRNAWLVVNWNKQAWQDDMIKIVIGKESVIIPRSFLETYMLYLAKDPSRFVRSKSSTVEQRYKVVSDNFYKKQSSLVKQKMFD